MRVHYLQHVPFEGPGSVEAWARAGGHTLTSTRFYSNEAPPPVGAFDWLIVMGGPMSVYQESGHPWLRQEKRFIESAIKAGRAVLGVCLGSQLLADVLGAAVYPNGESEIGWFPVQKTPEAAALRAFEALAPEIEAFHWHADTFDLPAGAIHLARSAACENQAFACGDRVIGVQFHLEMTRAAAEQLIRNCAAEIVDGPFIQSADAMLSDGRRFERANEAMGRLMGELQTTLDGPGSGGAAAAPGISK